MIPQLLHLGHYTDILTPSESHRFFGAGFLFLGVLLVVEVAAGKVWFRSRIRTIMWPIAAMMAGQGLIIVAILDPNERVIHFTTGLLILTAGWLEMHYRSGKIGRVTADMFVVPALLVAAIEMGVIHGRGDTFTAIGHIAMGTTAAMMAGARIYHARKPWSFPRSTAMGFCVITLGLILLVLQP